MSAQRPPWKVVLIVEDDTDGRAARALAQSSGLGCAVDWVPASGIGNIKRRGPGLIRLAQDRIANGKGCVAVLVDRDGRNAERDEPHKSIRDHCRQAGVPYLEAVECLEAWLLADDGVCTWLEVKKAPRPDSLRDAKGTVSRAYAKKTGQTYQRRISRIRLARHATGVDASRSPSWGRACGHLNSCRTVGHREAQK